jgi:glycosyltransferase involved in cell wall biosynthesis
MVVAPSNGLYDNCYLCVYEYQKLAKPEILLVCIAFRPNVGGVETHLNDLVEAIVKRNWFCRVLTYMPLTVNTRAKIVESDPGYKVYRIPWPRNLFYKLVHSPILEFIYLVPGLFFVLPLLLLTQARNIKTIHSHGLIAGFVSVFWGKLFGKKVITTTHSIYSFPKSGWYRRFSRWVFSKSDEVLCLSNQSVREIADLGVDKRKITRFTYWIDVNRFVPANRASKDFIVLFVGRLVPEKGVSQLVEAAKMWNPKIKLQVIGEGPLKTIIPDKQFVGKVDQADLPKYYQRASLTIIPSVHEEGFGRVILESLACGTPVIGSNRGR